VGVSVPVQRRELEAPLPHTIHSFGNDFMHAVGSLGCGSDRHLVSGVNDRGRSWGGGIDISEPNPTCIGHAMFISASLQYSQGTLGGRGLHCVRVMLVAYL
jgi:hypothetical protein